MLGSSTTTKYLALCELDRATSAVDIREINTESRSIQQSRYSLSVSGLFCFEDCWLLGKQTQRKDKIVASRLMCNPNNSRNSSPFIKVVMSSQCSKEFVYSSRSSASCAMNRGTEVCVERYAGHNCVGLLAHICSYDMIDKCGK